MSNRSRLSLRAASRALFALGVGSAAMLLSSCVSTYGYRGGEGDYYYAEPQIDYYGYGPYGSIGHVGDWYGSVIFRYGNYPRYGYPHYGYPYSRYYGYYGYPYNYYGYRPPRPRPPGHHTPPPHYPPPQNPPPVADGGDDDYDPRDLRDREGGNRWRYLERRQRPNDQRPEMPPVERPRGPVVMRGSEPRMPPREAPQWRPSAPSPAPAVPSRPAAPPAAPPPRPVYSERPVRDVDHEP